MRKTKCIIILSSMALSLATVGNAGAQLLDCLLYTSDAADDRYKV